MTSENIENVAETAFIILTGNLPTTSNMNLYNNLQVIANEKNMNTDFIKNRLIKYHLSRYGPQ